MIPLQPLLKSWLKVSMQSFGGGTATLALIRSEFVDRQGWVPENQFLRDWAMCQLAPGINLIALTILIGKRLSGWLGVLISLAGMLLPSFAITVLLTAFYARYMHTNLVSHAMRGLMPAVAAVGLATAFGMGKPIYASLKELGPTRFAFFAALFAAAILAMALAHLPTVAIVLGGGALSAIFNSIWERRSTP